MDSPIPTEIGRGMQLQWKAPRKAVAPSRWIQPTTTMDTHTLKHIVHLPKPPGNNETYISSSDRCPFKPPRETNKKHMNGTYISSSDRLPLKPTREMTHIRFSKWKTWKLQRKHVERAARRSSLAVASSHFRASSTSSICAGHFSRRRYSQDTSTKEAALPMFFLFFLGGVMRVKPGNVVYHPCGPYPQ